MSRKIIIWGKTYQKTVIGSGQKVEIPFNRTVTRAFGASRDRRSGPCQVAERAPPPIDSFSHIFCKICRPRRLTFRFTMSKKIIIRGKAYQKTATGPGKKSKYRLRIPPTFPKSGTGSFHNSALAIWASQVDRKSCLSNIG